MADQKNIVLANWNANKGQAGYIENKPSDVAFQADWNNTDKLSKSYIRNKPSFSQVNPDWKETNLWSKSYIRNKPDIEGLINSKYSEKLQANWAQTDPKKPDFIKNKPTFSMDEEGNVSVTEKTEIKTVKWENVEDKPDIESLIITNVSSLKDTLEADISSKYPEPSDENGTYTVNINNVVQADWNATNGTSQILNKPDINSLVKKAETQADWSEKSVNSLAFIKNKPTAADMQANWLETNTNSYSYIKNKPNFDKLFYDMIQDFRLGSGLYYEVREVLNKNPHIILENCDEFRLKQMTASSQITIQLPHLDYYNQKFSSKVIFSAANTNSINILQPDNTSITYKLQFIGDDINKNIFTPQLNKRYELFFKFDGYYMVCSVKDFAISERDIIDEISGCVIDRASNMSVDEYNEIIRFYGTSSVESYEIYMRESGSTSSETLIAKIPYNKQKSELVEYDLENSAAYLDLLAGKKYDIIISPKVDGIITNESSQLVYFEYTKIYPISVITENSTYTISNEKIMQGGRTRIKFKPLEEYGIKDCPTVLNAQIEYWKPEQGLLGIYRPYNTVEEEGELINEIRIIFKGSKRIKINYQLNENIHCEAINEILSGKDLKLKLTLPNYCNLSELSIIRDGNEIDILTAPTTDEVYKDNILTIKNITSEITIKGNVVENPELKITSTAYKVNYNNTTTLLSFRIPSDVETTEIIVNDGVKDNLLKTITTTGVMNITLKNLEEYNNILGGNHKIIIKTSRTGFKSSEVYAYGLKVSYELVYKIDETKYNIIKKPISVSYEGSQTIELSAKEGNELPIKIYVYGATSDWDNETGIITVSGPYGVTAEQDIENIGKVIIKVD